MQVAATGRLYNWSGGDRFYYSDNGAVDWNEVLLNQSSNVSNVYAQSSLALDDNGDAYLILGTGGFGSVLFKFDATSSSLSEVANLGSSYFRGTNSTRLVLSTAGASKSLYFMTGSYSTNSTQLHRCDLNGKCQTVKEFGTHLPWFDISRDGCSYCSQIEGELVIDEAGIFVWLGEGGFLSPDYGATWNPIAIQAERRPEHLYFATELVPFDGYETLTLPWTIQF